MLKTNYTHDGLEEALKEYFEGYDFYDAEEVDEPDVFSNAYYVMKGDDELGCVLVKDKQLYIVKY